MWLDFRGSTLPPAPQVIQLGRILTCGVEMRTPPVPLSRAGSEDTQILWAPGLATEKDRYFRKHGYKTPVCFHVFCPDWPREKDSEFLKSTALAITLRSPKDVESEVSRIETGTSALTHPHPTLLPYDSEIYLWGLLTMSVLSDLWEGATVDDGSGSGL